MLHTYKSELVLKLFRTGYRVTSDDESNDEGGNQFPRMLKYRHVRRDMTSALNYRIR